MNITELERIRYITDHHTQIVGKNYFAYSNGQTTLPKSSLNTSLYVYLQNETDRDILIYPGQITSLSTSPSADIYFVVKRYKNSIVDTSTSTALNSFNLGDIYGSITEELTVYPVLQANVSDVGDEVVPLESFVIGGQATNEEERGERYVLKKGESILAEITNLLDKDLNVFIRSFWSFT